MPVASQRLSPGFRYFSEANNNICWFPCPTPPTRAYAQLAHESVPTCAPAYCNQFLYFVYPCVYPNAKRVMEIFHNPLIYLVGAKGFEPSTPCSQSRCATKLRHAPQECAVANAGAESVGETNCCLPSRRGVCPDMTTICLKVVPIKAHFLRGTIALSV